MANVVKNIARKSRDKLMGGTLRALNRISEQIEAARRESHEASMLSHETHLKINHTQMIIQGETLQRVKNSGTIYLNDHEILTKIFSGLKMYLNPDDLAITPHLALDSIWEHRVTAAWLKVLKPNDTVLDIGANNGYYGALAAQGTDKKHSKVLMFEANPQLIPYIQKTLSVNWLNEQTVLENLAVADKPGKLTLHVLKDYIGSSSVQPNKEVEKYMKGKMRLETAREVSVQAVRLDDYFKEHGLKTFDLAIMDIEGFEDKAYAGMKGIVKASPNATLFVEFTKDAYADAKGFYNEMLADFGHVYVLDDDGHLVKPKNTSYETVIGDPDDWVMPIFSKNANLAGK